MCSRCNRDRSTPPSIASRRKAGSRAEWGASDKGKRAKFYSLTAAGRKQLGREQQDWARLSTAIALVLKKA